jgi:hypothetical protein
VVFHQMRGGCVFDPIRAGGERGAGQPDFEVGDFPATIEGLLRQRMNHGNTRHVRLLAKSEAQTKGAMGGQVTNDLSVPPVSSSSYRVMPDRLVDSIRRTRFHPRIMIDTASVNLLRLLCPAS